jgi:hypothetical protein
MIVDQRRRRFIHYFIPQYDEVVLFAMSMTCALLIITGIMSNYQEVELFISGKYDPKIIVPFVFVAIFMSGLVLSLYHAFVNRVKTSIEKSSMLFFAVLVNVFSGFVASGYNLSAESGWLIVFPVLNMINSIVLLLMWRYGFFDETSISDRQASKGQIILAAAVVLILFYICQVMYRLFWIQTLSICLVYSINFVRLIESMVFRPIPANNID